MKKNKKSAVFGSKTDRKIYPVDVQPNRFGNENQPVNLCQGFVFFPYSKPNAIISMFE